MTVTRFLNGKEMSVEELYRHNLTNPTIEALCVSVINQVQKKRNSSCDVRITKYVELAKEA